MSTDKPVDMSLDASAVATLSKITTATITTILLKKGLRNTWMRNTRPLHPDQPRVVGRAFTLRFVPWREDLATPESWSSPISTRAAIEAMPAGCIAVADAMGEADAGIFGDILCARMVKKSVAGLVTDGVVRDVSGVLSTGLPVWCQGGAAPPYVARPTFVAWQQPIACGGVAVFPGDVVVVDDTSVTGNDMGPQGEIQQVTIDADGGSFQLRFEDGIPAHVTAPIFMTTFTTSACPTLKVTGVLVETAKPERSACTTYTPSGINGAE